MMETAVHFGAGKIGRGFIADLLHGSGYKIVFADVVQSAIDEINKSGAYHLFLIDHNYEDKIIDNISAISTITQKDAVVAEIAKATVVTTSVMATNLDKVAPVIAEGLAKRLGTDQPKATVMACENAIMGTDILKKAMIDTGIISEAELNEVAIYPNTAVDRMVFDGEHHGVKGIEIGDAYELAVESNQLNGAEPVKGAEYVDNLEMFLQRKIYIINCGHAITAYLGQLNNCETVQDVLKVPELLKQIKDAMLESAAALEKKYGFTHESLEEYIDTMFIKRYTTPGVSDPITRVGREPIRKLSSNDRILGPAIECERLDLDNHLLLRGAAAGFHFTNPADKQAVELQKEISDNGIEAAVEKYTGLAKDSKAAKYIVSEYQRLA